jgi:hypothetical protein
MRIPANYPAYLAAKILIRSLIWRFSSSEITSLQGSLLRAALQSPSLRRAIFERCCREWSRRIELGKNDSATFRRLFFGIAETAPAEMLRDAPINLLLYFFQNEAPIPQFTNRISEAVRERMASDPDPNWMYFHANFTERPEDAVAAITNHLRINRLHDEVRWKGDRMIPFAFGNPAALNETPLISVIMPARNAESTIEQAMCSVLDQTWRNLELIVCDDASTDRTRALAEEVARGDPRVTLIGLVRHGGAYIARNEALQHARGELVAIHDADDISHPQRLERSAQSILHGDAVGVLADRVEWREEGGFAYSPGGFLEARAATFIMRRSVIDKIGWYDCAFASADTEYLNRLLRSFGRNAIKNNPMLAVIGLKSASNLTARPGIAIEFGYFSPARIAYQAAAKRWHKSAPSNKLYMPYPLTGKRPFPLTPELEIPEGPHGSVQLFPVGENSEETAG